MMTPNPNTQTKRLLSHLTLAGAAALAGSAANAQITVVPVNETIGMGGGSEMTSFTSSIPGISQFTINATSFHPGPFVHDVSVIIHNTNILAVKGVHTTLSSHAYLNTSAGKKFSTLNGSTLSRKLLVGSDNGGVSFPSYLHGLAPSYISFEFAPSTSGPYFDYGWIELGAYSVHSPSVTIEAYAYDLTPNQQLPGGYTGNSANVPEPSPALALAAFSALALGAAGVRRLKALKAAA